MSLEFTSMLTECSYDYVFVYDGRTYDSPLLGSFSGGTKPDVLIATAQYVSQSAIHLVSFSHPSLHRSLTAVTRMLVSSRFCCWHSGQRHTSRVGTDPVKSPSYKIFFSGPGKSWNLLLVLESPRKSLKMTSLFSVWCIT